MVLARPVFGIAQATAQRQSPAKQQDPQAAISQLVGDLQTDLEGSSSSSLLGKIDRTRFEDFAGFRDIVERLTRDDTLRVYFRQTSSTVKEGQAQTVLDAEMEMTRKDSTLQAQQRKQQITIDLARTSRGWKIINIAPRDFFEPL
jgi:hypothetical protein